MSRPTDWSPLGEPCDRVPGDPEAVQSAAASYRHTATAINNAHRTLIRLDDTTVSKGSGLDKILDDIKQVRDQLDKVEGRVAGVARVLEEYHPCLREAQTLSVTALREAEAARAAADRASRQCEAASRRYHSCNDPELRDDHRQDYNRYNNAVCAANGDLAAAKRKLQQAIQQRDDAAQRAIRDIEDIDGDSEVTDNLLDKIIDFIENLPDWVKGVFDVIASVIEFIAEWGWVLQVAVGLVSLVFPPASAALAAITLALKVVEVANLAIKGVKAAYAGIKAINGDGPPEDFIAGLVDIGVSIGIAKAAGAAGKAVSKQIPINTGSSNIATKATDNVRDSVSGVVSGLAVPAFRNIWNGVENLWAPLVGKENQSDTYHQQICTPAPPDSGVGEW